jgi:hypothetical protein
VGDMEVAIRSAVCGRLAMVERLCALWHAKNMWEVI